MLTLGIVAMEGRGFEYPTDSVMAPNGRIYVPNKSRNFGERGVRVTALNLESEFYGTFATYGTSEGKLQSPSSIAATEDGKLLVCDDYTHTINLFDLDGSFLTRWGSHGTGIKELNGPSGIAIDRDNNVYISDTRNHRIQKFNIEGVHSLDLAHFLDYEGIYIRSGHHCCQPLMQALGITACARASFYFYNNTEEVDFLVDKINKAIQVIK